VCFFFQHIYKFLYRWQKLEELNWVSLK
jgi:hypothetical protein